MPAGYSGRTSLGDDRECGAGALHGFSPGYASVGSLRSVSEAPRPTWSVLRLGHTGFAAVTSVTSSTNPVCAQVNCWNLKTKDWRKGNSLRLGDGHSSFVFRKRLLLAATGAGSHTLLLHIPLLSLCSHGIIDPARTSLTGGSHGFRFQPI